MLAIPWLRLLPGIIILALIFAVVGQRSHINSLRDKVTMERAARDADRQLYKGAQDMAAEKNKADIERIKQQQESINDETVSDLNSRLERIRRELFKVPSAPPGSPKSPGASGPSEAPCRAIDPAWLCVSPSDRLRGAENEERHDQLISWVERQSQVKP